ncbi:hypothetical protein HY498_00555 [Candidatus Woesearchaeota archaeon]|nr:hypothetical protein [Candidatus Woesearchaeota archaeon]
MKTNLIEKIKSLELMRQEEPRFEDLTKYLPNAELLLEQALSSQNGNFNCAAYMVAYTVISTVFPLMNSNGNWNRYQQHLKRFIYLASTYQDQISELNPRFLVDESLINLCYTGKNNKLPERKTKAFYKLERRIAELTFSDSPKDIRERPKFYFRFRLTEKQIPERLKEALNLRSKEELYKYKQSGSEENLIRSYSLIFLVMPLLGIINQDLVEDWLKEKSKQDN